MAAPARLQRRDALTLKNELNVNMVRCSHYPQSPHFLDACGELGIMVWQEPPGWVSWATPPSAALPSDVTSMVIRDRNRPSVIVWGTSLTRRQNYPALYARPAARLPLRRVAPDGRRGRFHSTAAGPRTCSPTTTTTSSTASPSWTRPWPASRTWSARRLAPPWTRSYRWFDPPATLANQAYAHARAHDQAQADPRYAGAPRLGRGSTTTRPPTRPHPGLWRRTGTACAPRA